MLGGEEDLRLSIERASGKDVDSPKHGKIDEKNAPHVGGNTWAGDKKYHTEYSSYYIVS